MEHARQNATCLQRCAILAAIIAPFACYLEWGGGQHAFVYETAYELLFGGKGSADAFLHPLILLPFAGLLLLLYALFRPGRRPLRIGLILIGVFVVLVFIVGLLARNVKIAGSATPFLLAALWCWRIVR